MNVFCDFHHASLLQSFILLFEKRLGGKVYRPIGVDWYEKGYWKVYDHPATVQQFLAVGGATPDNTPELNNLEENSSPGIYLCKDIDSGKTNKAITLDAFFYYDFDIVIASIPQHLPLFRKLCDEHPSHPKLIYQIGNAWPIDADVLKYTKNVMASALIPDYPKDINLIQYHQEFDTDIFYPGYEGTNAPIDRISSFVNCFSVDRLFAEDWTLFQIMEELMENWIFASYGGQCRDGGRNGTNELAQEMRNAKFIWHTKRGGDGYGHVLHNSAAVGRPIIFKKEYYFGKWGEKLMIDGVTGIQIDGLSPHEIFRKIQNYSDPEEYKKLCDNVYNNFKQIVDFDGEFLALKSFLGNLI